MQVKWGHNFPEKITRFV
ncbi:unnamed protein product [Acanthoscelides obtectus]|uniref:Uncharacterized protein n=1 Tax=Acanthoscelides obtectus TaxID=200917 RepID=A0A9P0JNW0_ACAOB|nr:unnamed protein product [Acanthoscelides obtectus]CAK1673967.1 hypothetical protein AOBTE_LOCUS29487 [Acanthoscelides obtectus]